MHVYRLLLRLAAIVAPIALVAENGHSNMPEYRAAFARSANMAGPNPGKIW